MRTIKKYDFYAIGKADAREQTEWGVMPYVIVDMFGEKKARIQNVVTSCMTLDEAEREVGARQ
jgi:hypothetical protein